MQHHAYTGKESGGGFRWGHWLIMGFCGLACGAMLILIGLAFIIPRVLDSAIETYTDDKPATISLVTLSEGEREALENRVDEFTRSIDAGEWAPPLRLSETEINGLLREELDDFDGAVKFRFRDNQVIGDLSVPLHTDFKLGPWERTLGDRFLNGQATFDLSIESGELELSLSKFEVSGKEIPDWILSQIQNRLDRAGWLNDEDVQEIVDKIDSLEVRNKEVILRSAKN
jgi:hypothetical protein